MTDKKRSHLNERWYAVSSPWGNGEYVVAGHIDPHICIFVCDCGNWDFDMAEDIHGDRWDVATPQEIAQRIADGHNEVLGLRRRVALLEKQLEAQKSAKQHVEDLWGI